MRESSVENARPEVLRRCYWPLPSASSSTRTRSCQTAPSRKAKAKVGGAAGGSARRRATSAFVAHKFDRKVAGGSQIFATLRRLSHAHSLPGAGALAPRQHLAKFTGALFVGSLASILFHRRSHCKKPPLCTQLLHARSTRGPTWHWHSTAHPKQRAGRESRPIDRRAEEERSHVTSLT